MPLPTLRTDIAMYTASAVTSATPWPPSTRNQCWSKNETFSGGSWRRDATSSGRSPASSEPSAARAARLAERTDANVAMPSTSVPPAVANEEISAQSIGRNGSRTGGGGAVRA